MRKKIYGLIIASYLVGFIFTLFEFDAVKRHKWHPFYAGHTYENGEFWDGRVTNAVFAYGFMEMVSRAIIFYAAYLAVRYGVFLRIFIVCFWVEVADMADYWLFRNDPYPFLPKFGNFGIEFNYIKFAIIVSFSAWEYRKYS